MMRGKVVRTSQCASCLISLTTFCDEITIYENRGKRVVVSYLDFNMAFDTTSHSILIWKLRNCGLDGYTAGGVENWLELLGSEDSYLDIQVAAGQECCILKTDAWADIVQYLHHWDEESKCTLSNVADFIKLRGQNDMPNNRTSIQSILRTWELYQQKLHEVQDRQGFDPDPICGLMSHPSLGPSPSPERCLILGTGAVLLLTVLHPRWGKPTYQSRGANHGVVTWKEQCLSCCCASCLHMALKLVSLLLLDLSQSF